MALTCENIYQESSVDESDNERVEEERKQFFKEAFCLRGSDSEDDLTDVDQHLEARDMYERRIERVRRVRRFYRRKVAVSSVPFTWGSGTFPPLFFPKNIFCLILFRLFLPLGIEFVCLLVGNAERAPLDLNAAGCMVWMATWLISEHRCIYIYIYMHICIHVYMYTHICIHICIQDSTGVLVTPRTWMKSTRACCGHCGIRASCRWQLVAST